MVDTCVGNDKERGNPAWNQLQTAFLDDMEKAGYVLDAIDNVLCTHLHIDHVGWNTMLVDGKWVPTFPKARYLIGQVEFAHWQADTDLDQTAVMADSVLPVFDANLVDLVETDHQISDEISLMPTVGHTPGHVSVMIRSNGEEAMITVISSITRANSPTQNGRLPLILTQCSRRRPDAKYSIGMPIPPL